MITASISYLKNIQNKESELAGLMEKDRLYLMGEDSEYKACVGVIHNALERQSVQNLLKKRT